MSGKNMKAWIVREKNEFCAAVVFAQTRRKAKVLAMQTDACDGADFMDIEVHRAKEADKYYQDGKTQLDWDNDADKIVLVKECGFVCDIDFFEPENCVTCVAKEYCDQYSDLKGRTEQWKD